MFNFVRSKVILVNYCLKPIMHSTFYSYFKFNKYSFILIWNLSFESKQYSFISWVFNIFLSFPTCFWFSKHDVLFCPVIRFEIIHGLSRLQPYLLDNYFCRSNFIVLFFLTFVYKIINMLWLLMFENNSQMFPNILKLAK